MIAINWFGLSFSSPTTGVAFAFYEPSVELPKRIRTNNHRTLMKRGDDGTHIYHVGRGAPVALRSFEVPLVLPPDDLPRLIIEMSFAGAISEAGFEVHFRHVGGVASHAAQPSSRPGIFELREGFAFRAFSFRDETRDEVRWGLVLNYLTSQRFMISLTHPVLRQYSLNKRVVRLGQSSDADSSGLLTEAGDSYLVIAHGDGTSTREMPSEWTAQCRKDVLFDFIAATENRKASSDVSAELQRASMAINSTGRLNVALARDQIAQVQRMITKSDLTQFRVLSTGEGPIARMMTEPLSIGE